tara:strand:+ start:90 stop:227 length:138 start_codon:yes stop_codon:yes gene_type:complete
VDQQHLLQLVVVMVPVRQEETVVYLVEQVVLVVVPLVLVNLVVVE